MVARAGIVRHPVLQIPRLADIEDLGASVQHAVNAGRSVQLLDVIRDDLVARAGYIVHANPGAVEEMILSVDCNVSHVKARGKLSTVSVDNSAEKISGSRNFLGFLALSLMCLFFRHISKALFLNEK